MPNTRKISISFKEEFFNMYEWIKQKDNASLYICRLVSADMQNEQHSGDLETKIETILVKLLKSGDLGDVNAVGKLKDRDTHESLSTEDKDLLNSIF